MNSCVSIVFILDILIISIKIKGGLGEERTSKDPSSGCDEDSFDSNSDSWGEGETVRASNDAYFRDEVKKMFDTEANDISNELLTKEDHFPELNTSGYHLGLDELMDKLNSNVHPLFSLVYDLALSKKSNREKRTLRVFPRGSRLLTKWNVIIPVKKSTMFSSSYNFDIYAFLPFFPFVNSLSRRRRSLMGDDPGEPLTDGEKAELRLNKQREKAHVFHQIEQALEGLGFMGRECLLKFLCDVAEKPLVHGLFGDVFNSIFRPSLHPRDLDGNVSTLNDIEDNYKPFLEAERHGKFAGNCELEFPKCGASLSDLSSLVDEKIWTF